MLGCIYVLRTSCPAFASRSHCLLCMRLRFVLRTCSAFAPLAFFWCGFLTIILSSHVDLYRSKARRVIYLSCALSLICRDLFLRLKLMSRLVFDLFLDVERWFWPISWCRTLVLRLNLTSRCGFNGKFDDFQLRATFLTIYQYYFTVTSCHQLCHQLKNPQNSMTFNWRPYSPHIYIYFWLSPVVTYIYILLTVTSCHQCHQLF